METVTTVATVRERVRTWRLEGQRIAFVPTMGNLHRGHISLIEAARRHGNRFIASIFVNPMQFGPNEDFAHYPRTPRDDERMLAEAGCDLMFMPDVAEVYRIRTGWTRAHVSSCQASPKSSAANSVRATSRA
jgi:pantoate--beta-alanine ligase